MLMFPDEEDKFINLNSYSFEQWVAFVFDHPATVRQQWAEDTDEEAEEEEDKSWYWQDEWEHWGSPEHLLPFITRLFQSPEFLLETYSTMQLRDGFWYLPNGGSLDDWIWDTRIEWRLREECILAMVPLFERLFIREPLQETCYMWWDFFRSFSDEQDAQVRDTMLLAMDQVLRLPSDDCRAAALHGLSHLNHPQKPKVIRRFLRSHPELDEKWRNFADAAIAGELL